MSLGFSEGTGSVGVPEMQSMPFAYNKENDPYGQKAVPKMKQSKRQIAVRRAAQKAIANMQRKRGRDAFKNRAKPLGGDHFGGAL